MSRSILVSCVAIVVCSLFLARGLRPEISDASAPELKPTASPSAAAGSPQSTSPRLDQYGDPLPPNALCRIGTDRFRSGTNIDALAFAPDGTSIVGESGGVIHTWDAGSGREIKRLRYGKPVIQLPGQRASSYSRVLGFSPDARRLLSDHWSWEVGVGEPVVAVVPESAGQVVAVSADGTRCVTIGFRVDDSNRDRSWAQLWKLPEAQRIAELAGPVRAARFLPNGRTLAIVTDRGISFRNPQTAESIADYELHPPAEKNLRVGEYFAVSDDEKYAATTVVSSNTPKEVHIWDLSAKQLVKALPLDGVNLWNLVFSPDGKRLAGVGQQEFWLWELPSGRVLCRRERLNLTSALAFSPDSRILAGGGSGCVRLFDAATGAPRFPVPFWDEIGHLMRLSADGRRVITVRDYRHSISNGPNAGAGLRVWDAESGQLIAEPDLPLESVLALSSHGTVVVGTTKEKTIQVWNLDAHAMTTEIRHPNSEKCYWVLSADGRWVTAFSEKKPSSTTPRTWHHWDCSTGAQISSSVAAEPGDEWYNPLHNKRLVFNKTEKCLEVWDMSPKVLHRLDYPESFLGEMLWPPDRAVPFVRTHKPGFFRWDLTTGKAIAPLEFSDYTTEHPSSFTSTGFVFLASSNRFLVGGHRGEVQMWDVQTEKRVKTWRTGDWPRSIAVSANGKRVASNEHGVVLVWDLDSVPDAGPSPIR